MEKKSIFKKIDELYTKATKKIIGDIPLDDDKPSSKKSTTKRVGQGNGSKINASSVKQTFGTLKEKFFNIGKSKDEKTLLYKEVIKREKQEEKELVKAKKEAKKIVAADKKEAKAEAKKKSTAKKSPTGKTTVNKKPTKKTASAKSTDTQEANKKETTKKQTTTKKTASPKTTSQKKAPVKTATKATKTKATTKKPTTKKTTAATTDTKASTSTKKVTTTKKTATKPTKKSVDNKTVNVKKTVAPKTNEKKKTDKKVVSKKAPTKKTTATPKGAKKAVKIALYIADIKKHYGEVDEPFVTVIVNNLGPSIYKRDAETVACSDPKELDTVRRNFLVKKLGIDASNGVLDAAIQDVCTELKGVRTKYRATFYYALAKKFKKESVLN